MPICLAFMAGARLVLSPSHCWCAVKGLCILCRNNLLAPLALLAGKRGCDQQILLWKKSKLLGSSDVFLFLWTLATSSEASLQENRSHRSSFICTGHRCISFFRVMVEKLSDTTFPVRYHRVKPVPMYFDVLSSASICSLCSDLNSY